MTLDLVRLDGGVLPESAGWAEGLVVRLPRDVADDLQSGALAAGNQTARGRAHRASVDLRNLRLFMSQAPAQTRLPFSYTRVPSGVRQVLARLIGWRQRRRQHVWAAFPGWPLDLSADVAADLSRGRQMPASPTPVLLTHDIDSPEGLDNLIRLFLPIEEAAGARSANYVVPCAWPVDPAKMQEILDRGHEVGVHGFDHSGKTPFAGAEERAERLRRGWEFGSRYGGTGYRAPSLFRSEQLLAGLANHYQYDSSIPTSGGPFPVPNNGCASARPWRIGNIWEIPLSLPRDGSLRFMGHSATEISAMWLDLARRISRSGGVVTLLTHCEERFSGNDEMIGAYQKFVSSIAADARFRFVLPASLVRDLSHSNQAD